jgi:uncharacterized protein
MATVNSSNDLPVSWLVDEIAVNASLTRPEGAGPFPAVIMVAGSGPTDRNWNSPLIPGTNGSAELLSRVLTNAGFITLRYDKRPSGPQLKENAMRMAGHISMQGHLEELAGGVRLLADREDVDSSHIFVLTNSEGCIHALNYQNQAADLHFSGLVLTSPPARPIGVVAHGQIAAQLSDVPGGDQMLASYDQAIQDFTAGRPVKVDETLPEGLRNALLGITNPFNLPFARELWSTDAAKLLESVHNPVFVVLGKKDIQVTWQIDGPIFDELARTHSNVEVAYIENANHVLKYEPRPLSQLTMTEIMMSYNADTSVLDSDAAQAILAWLKNQA